MNEINLNTWESWKNQNSPGDLRTSNDALVLPFNKTSHHGVRDINNDLIVRYRFGQKQSLANQSSLDLPLQINENISLSDDGIKNNNSNGYLTSVNATGSYFNYPSSSNNRAYISFWFKSNINYYAKKAYIIAYHNGIETANISCGNISNGSGGDIGWAVIIDNNKIKAIVGNNRHVAPTLRDVCIDPVGGPVEIDTNWHHVVLFLGKSKSGIAGNTEVMLVLDNNFNETEYTNLADSGPLGDNDVLSIGSTPYDSQYGFIGTIDEVTIANWYGSASDSIDTTTDSRFGLLEKDFNPSYRFASNVFLSPVTDTEKENNLSSFISKFDTPNGSSIMFSFRASDSIFEYDDNTVPWSGFIKSNTVSSEKNINLSDIGLKIKGRYFQIRMLLNPSDDNSPFIDKLSLESPSVYYVKLSFNNKNEYSQLGTSRSSFISGSILGQVVEFVGSKKIHKVSLNCTINNQERKTFIEGSNGTLSFQASNFQSGRDFWVFQPINHWNGGWESSGTTITNFYQTESYDDLESSLEHAPYLEYSLYFPEENTYDLWGYGYIDGDGLYWSFNENKSNLNYFTLGSDLSGWQGVPKWTKFGSIYVEKEGIYKFRVYLKGRNTVVLDQWYFTTNINLKYEFDIIGENALSTPLPLSSGPFNTALRLKGLTTNGELNSDDPYANSITAWLPSTDIFGSGNLNYEIRNQPASSGVKFTNGLSIEFWQIGGTKDYCALWNFSFTGNPVGQSFRSDDYGQNYFFEN